MRDVLLTAFVPIIWGTTYFVTTEFLPANRPLTTAALRALPVGLILLAIFRQLPQGAWRLRAAILGALNIGFFFALLFIGAYRLPGGVAAVASAIQPLMVAFLAYFLLGENLTRVKVLAAFLGIGGVSLIVLKPAAHLDTVGLIAVFVGTLMMATATVLLKRWGKPPVSLLVFTSWQLVFVGLMLAPAALIVEGIPPPMNATNIFGYIYLGSVGTGLAYALWFRGIARLNASTVTFLALLSSVTAVFIDAVFLGKWLSVWQIAGVLLVLLGIALAQKFQAEGSGKLNSQGKNKMKTEMINV